MNANRPPEITSDPIVNASAGTPYTYDVEAIDPDGDILTYSIIDGPEGMIIDSATGNVDWPRPQFDARVDYVVSDGTSSKESLHGLAIGSDGSVFVVGSWQPHGAPFLAKYSADGSRIWKRDLNHATAVALALDHRDNIYVTGLGDRTFIGGYTDTYVVKYDSAGDLLWEREVSSDGCVPGYGDSIDVDAAGNVYVTGRFARTMDFDPGPDEFSFSPANGKADAYVWKLTSDGTFSWVRSIGGDYESGHADYAQSVAVDADGNVYSVGPFMGTGDFDPGPNAYLLQAVGPTDTYVLRLDSNGDFSWAGHFGGSQGSAGDQFVEVDSAGNVYVTGTFAGTVDFDPGPGIHNLTSAGDVDVDGYLVKLDDQGSFLWAKQMGGVEHDFLNSIAFDAHDNVYVTGTYRDVVDLDPGPNSLIVTAGENASETLLWQLNPDGELLWLGVLAGGVNDSVSPFDLALDNQGQVYLAGAFQGSIDFDPDEGERILTSLVDGNTDPYLLKFNLSAQHPVTVRVEDGRSGFDEQSFTINVGQAAPGEIRGAVFNDLNGDGLRDIAPTLLVSNGQILRYNATNGAYLDSFLQGGDLQEGFCYGFGPDGDLYVGDWATARILRYDGSTGGFRSVVVVDPRLSGSSEHRNWRGWKPTCN